MAKRGNRTKYAVLGLLSLGSCSGYEIKKQFERELLFFWNESYGQIYPTLKRLVDEDLATVEMDQRDTQHDRKLYTITDEGRQELASWLRQPAHIHAARHETLLKLFLGASMTPELCITHLQSMKDELLVKQEALQKERELLKDSQESPHNSFQLLTLRYGEQVNAVAIAWCNDALEEYGVDT